nr:hypothetical protein [Tanacetum cinerariifolium]
MANNETYTCLPSEVCLSNSDSELLIPTPWSNESKNEKRQKGREKNSNGNRSLFEIDFTFGINAFDLDKGTDVMKDTVSQKNVCEEEVPLNNNIGKQIGDFIDMYSEAVKKRMNANVPGEIDGAKGEQVPNHVVKKGLNLLRASVVPNSRSHCQRPLKKFSFREDLENKLTSQEELAVLQVELADMEGRMPELMEEFKKSQKMLSFGSQLQ